MVADVPLTVGMSVHAHDSRGRDGRASMHDNHNNDGDMHAHDSRAVVPGRDGRASMHDKHNDRDMHAHETHGRDARASMHDHTSGVHDNVNNHNINSNINRNIPLGEPEPEPPHGTADGQRCTLDAAFMTVCAGQVLGRLITATCWMLIMATCWMACWLARCAR